MAVLRKVGIIGIGHVGAHVANAVLSAGLAEELKLCDINDQKVVSECQDLSDALSFYPHNCVIGNYGTQYEQLADCDVVINAAGDVKTSAKNRDGELFVTTDIARTWIDQCHQQRQRHFGHIVLAEGLQHRSFDHVIDTHMVSFSPASLIRNVCFCWNASQHASRLQAWLYRLGTLQPSCQ